MNIMNTDQSQSQKSHTAQPQEPTKSAVSKKEESILSFWQQNNIFQKTLEKESPQGTFVFYDGPPFATGLPHYGHLLPGTIKDIIPRYKTMQGYHVPRKWGWDCHGLPIENLIEKELGLATKKDIEDYGIEKFNEAARNSVLRYEEEWKHYVPRSGRWADMDTPYMSMQSSYMESVWWVFNQLYTKGLTKEGFKPMHLCPRCETTLANFEVNQGYQDVTDISVTAKFELVDEPNTFFLAWTTTPWTLPGNVALAVGTDIDYAVIERIQGDITEKFIVAFERINDVFEKELVKNGVFHDDVWSEIENGKTTTFKMIDRLYGKELVGKAYTPVFDFYQQQTDLQHRENGWKVYAADFVTTEDGTGIVHIAPAFGSDDMELGKEHYLPFVQHVGKNGAFLDDFASTTDNVPFKGMLVKKKGDLMTTDIEIIKKLAHTEKLFSKKKLVHSYPHCWRCDTPLLNYATSSWYVDVPQLKDRLMQANTEVNWTPKNIGEGRFGKWLEGARDWALSRSRFWGTPLPVWQSQKNDSQPDTFVPGSIQELLDHVETSGNQYFGIRHGEAESNVTGMINANPDTHNPLTEKGRQQVHDEIASLPSDIDYVFVSPLQRTRETAAILQQELGLSDEQIIVDERLRERSPGSQWEGRSWHDAHQEEESQAVHDFWHYRLSPDAESIADVYTRTFDCMFDIESRYANKKIVIVSHGGVLKTVQFGILHYGNTQQAHEFFYTQSLPKNADALTFDFKPFPHNEDYQIDLHRPYIDDLKVVKDGMALTRIEDVFDVWFDSGSMPYAQAHYPFENKDVFKGNRFPAQFIAEGLDQTRGWFYVLSVLGVALFDTIPFENVVVNGLVLAEDGKKMSKRLKNYPEIDVMLDSTGADALRLFLIASPLVRAEEHAFSEKGVQEVASKVMGRLRNSMSLYLMSQGDQVPEPSTTSSHVLDQWILGRLYEFNTGVSEHLDRYELDKAARFIFDFVDDFSTWYIRRSRDRLKEQDAQALATTRFVLEETAKIIAPFVPFVAEEMWQQLRESDSGLSESVHLVSWSSFDDIQYDQSSLEMMQTVRDLISQGLQLRSAAKIKVRQPLQSLTIEKEYPEEYYVLIRDEMNIKQVLVGDELALDTTLTPELEAEGNMRELLRAIQSLRKKSGLEASDMVTLHIQTSTQGQQLIEQFSDDIKKTAGISEFNFAHNEAYPPEADAPSSKAGLRGDEIKVGELLFIVAIEK